MLKRLDCYSHVRLVKHDTECGYSSDIHLFCFALPEVKLKSLSPTLSRPELGRDVQPVKTEVDIINNEAAARILTFHPLVYDATMHEQVALAILAERAISNG